MGKSNSTTAVAKAWNFLSAKFVLNGSMIIWRILPVIVVVHIATTPCGRKLEEVYNNSTTTYSCCAPLIARITLVYNDSELNRANESARHISRNQTGSPSEGNCEKVTIPNLKMNNNTVVVCFFQNLVGCHGKTNITHIVNGPSPKTRNMVLNISSAGTTSPSSGIEKENWFL